MSSALNLHLIEDIDRLELATNFNSCRGIFISSRALLISNRSSRLVDFHGRPTRSLFSAELLV